MFVGETGVDRIVARTCELMKRGDVRAQGGIDLATLQKYLNLWFSLSEDLFGGEISSNAADFFAAGVKGRYKEAQYQDHRALDGSYKMTVVEEGKLVEQDIPLRTAMNEVLRDGYVEDCQRAVNKWNRTIEAAGFSERLRLPNRRFHRQQGIYAAMPFDVDGRILSSDEFARRAGEWLPTEADHAYVASLMKPVHEPGKIANWIAPPTRGINGQPFEFQYVRAD
jgi:benzoyl-CoA 2,3-dioxygenase component B